ncbi:hypothetical protein H2203_004525 [Taxawa tesnikishii (nom. ined.)]|nr:hypothetical protein H2203_004525 [Dothideales sp. JES 119]
MPAPKNPFQPYADRHKEIKGPGDARPTALEVVQDLGLNNTLTNRVFLVTGCTAGLGIETARALYATGAHVFMTVRDVAKGSSVIKDIRSSSPDSHGSLTLLEVDLSSFASIRAGVTDFLSKSTRLDVLICNAGVMMCPYSTTAEGFEMQLGTNHYGHFLLFQLLKSVLEESSTPEHTSRVVFVSSSGHSMGPIRFDDMNFSGGATYDKHLAYAQSKTANIYAASSIERHFGSSTPAIHGISVHPGAIMTDLARHMTPADFESFGASWLEIQKIMKNPQQGAATQVWAAVTPYFNDKGGVYCTDVGEAGPMTESTLPGGPGYYEPHAYDQEAEEKLWSISCEAVGVNV